MTAAGKITVNDILRRTLGTVRVLITTGPGGKLVPATRKTGATVATITGVTPVAGNRRTRYYLATDRGSVNNLAPHQTFWLAPDGDAQPTAAARFTVKQIRERLWAGDSVRVLITDDREYGVAGRGTWRTARTPKLKSWQSAAPHGEPASVHAATVTEIRSCDGDTVVSRYDVVTNLGTVEYVTLSQPFRAAPDGMRDTADVRAETRADREAREARQAYDRANPLDVDRTNVSPGDLIELLGAERWNKPHHVVRVLRVGGIGTPIVPRPYERAYGDCGPGEGFAHGFRRLPDQDDSGGLALRSCGCPAPIRQAIIPPPADGDTEAWRTALRRRDVEDHDEAAHRPGCHWATEPEGAALRVMPGCNDEGREAFTVHACSVGAGETCGCPGVDRYAGDLLYAADRAAALLALFPPRQHPDRTGLADRVTFAPCCPLPAAETPADPFVSDWALTLAATAEDNA